MVDLINTETNQHLPLAAKLRPQSLDQFVGQQHLLAENKPLWHTIHTGHIHSMILWGPPGVGKTTLAYLLAASSIAVVERISAVLAGVAEIKKIVAQAKQSLKLGQRTILFVDEVHRFNKSQQDAFLPHVEEGTIILIGATTENPAFQLNNALLSRVRVYVLKPLSHEDLMIIYNQAMLQQFPAIKKYVISDSAKEKLLNYADGDARRLLGIIEILSDFIDKDLENIHISDELLASLLQQSLRRFDQHADVFYEQISALHKSVRGSDPDAALYWLCRMFDGGCDINYLIRRIIRMASEDIGNADPRALQIAINASSAYDRLGSPEGELAVAQAVVYLASAAKSNAVYKAYNAVTNDIKNQQSYSVPNHLCNAPTKLQKQLGYGESYQYDHDFPDAIAYSQRYFPEAMQPVYYYLPVERGLESKIKQKLDYIRVRRSQACLNQTKTQAHANQE